MAQVYNKKAQQNSAASPEAVTVRAVVIGLIVLVAADFYINWGTLLLRASKLNKSYFPMGLFFPMVALVFLNAQVQRWGTFRALSSGELRVVLGMGLIGAFFPFFGLAGFLVGVIAAPYYLATSENGWADMLHPHMPSWVVLNNDAFAATWFYEGLPPGQSVPWVAWAVPLFWWGTLVGAIGMGLLCLMVILRKQWVENERLEYPLVAVGAQLATAPDDPAGLMQMTRLRGFRIAFVIGFLAVGWNVVHYFAPLIPELPTVPTSGHWFRWLDGAPRFWVQISIYIIGFAYFARVDALILI